MARFAHAAYGFFQSSKDNFISVAPSGWAEIPIMHEPFRIGKK